MRKIFTLLLTCSAFLTAQATLHEVEVGGNPFAGVAPYYTPQFITIQAGDTVRWTWADGFHSVTSTSGPTSFDSGETSGPFVFQVTFNTAGLIEYECTVGNHADTQFGTITVEDQSTGILLPEAAKLYPMPFAENLHLSVPDLKLGSQIEVIEIANGRPLLSFQYAPPLTQLPLGELPRGPYLLRIRGDRKQYVQFILKK